MEIHQPGDSLLQPDMVIAGTINRYRIIRHLSQGMRGETALAITLNTDIEQSSVVIKVPRIDIKRSLKETQERIFRIQRDMNTELNAWIRLSKSALVRSYIAEFKDNGVFNVEVKGEILIVPFIVQEFVAGEPLEVWCNRNHSTASDSGMKEFTGIQEAKEWFQISIELMTQLSLVHRERVVHGDIWPPNIIMKSVEDKYVPVLIDFGQAWLADHALHKLGEDTISWQYYAPERLAKEDSYWYAPADIYSMCGILFYLATGKNPISPYKDDDSKIFKTKTVLKAEISKIIRERNPALYYSNLGIVDIIMYGLRPKVDERAFSAEHIIDLIINFQRAMDDHTNYSDSLSLVSIDTDKWIQRVNDLEDEVSQASYSRGTILHRLLAQDVVHLQRQIINVCSQEGRMYTVPGGNHDELVRYMLTSLGGLHEGDQILAQTTPLFWYRKNFGPNGRVMTMLKIAALKGVTIRWLLLVERGDEQEDEWSDELEVRPILRSHKLALEQVEQIAKHILKKPFQNQLKDLNHGGFYIGVRLVDAKRREEIVRRAETFVLINQRDIDTINSTFIEHQTLIAPTYTYRGGGISSLRFWRNPERWADEFAESFNENLRESVSISEFKDL